MHNEHFGISVVEAMAASTIILSNDSGGPQMDIVKEYEKHCVGYLSITREEYATTILRIVEEGETKRNEIRNYARKSLTRFGEAAFEVRLKSEGVLAFRTLVRWGAFAF
uniref:Glycos_transf_1 domain-containing protein n=1 Tax=Caenorhabditis japonica TaxID=281687 RepID=A0A8R1EWU3_CAEJA